jgi:hypothetical protein
MDAVIRMLLRSPPGIRFASPDANIEPLMAAASERGVPLEIVDLDHADAAAIYGRKFVLVRSDGHIAWRDDVLPDDAVSLVDHVRGADLAAVDGRFTNPWNSLHAS